MGERAQERGFGWAHVRVELIERLEIRMHFFKERLKYKKVKLDELFCCISEKSFSKKLFSLINFLFFACYILAEKLSFSLF